MARTAQKSREGVDRGKKMGQERQWKKGLMTARESGSSQKSGLQSKHLLSFLPQPPKPPGQSPIPASRAQSRGGLGSTSEQVDALN